MIRVSVKVNGRLLRVPEGATLEELADKLWIGASFEVDHFVVDGAFIDRSGWSNEILAESAEIIAWQVEPSATPRAAE